jgi:putative flippase GtrA
MDLSPAAVLGRFRGKALRYLAVSALFTVTTQALLLLFIGRWDWSFALANFVAVGITMYPSYLVNRHWVWGKRGDHSWAREVVPFWAMTVAGLVLSTLLAAVANVWTDTTWVASAANLGAFGVLWVVKFVVIDAYVFAASEPSSIGSAE